MKIHSVLVVKGVSNYNVVLEFADEMVQEWEKTCQVEFLDGNNLEDYQAKKNEIMNGKKYDLVFSFNALAWEEEPELMRVLMQGHTIYATHLLDHPLHHHTRLMKMDGSKCVVFAPDQYHVSYVKQYYPHIRHCAFMPHGGSSIKRRIPYQQREHAVVFMGTYTSSRQIQDKLSEKGEFQRILQEELMHQMEEHSDWTIEQAFLNMIQIYQMEEKEEEIPFDLAALADADIYMRSLYREKVINTLLEAGIPVEVYGDHWEDFVCKDSSLLHVHSACDYQGALSIMANAKIVLNVMPWFKDGSHERVFSALGCGAIALTDKSRYLQCLDEQSGIKLYDLNNLQKLPAQVRKILNDTSESRLLAEAGYQNCIKKHLWANRALEMKCYIEQKRG